MDVVEPKLLAHCGELLKEELDAPQRRVVGLPGVATPQLIVEDDRAPTIGELLKGFKVVRRPSGTAMEHQWGELSRLWLGEVSDDTVSNAEPSKRDETLTNRRGRWHVFLCCALTWQPT